MSWKYRLYNIEPDQTVSIEPVNENFLAIVDEFGSLDEHNFASGAFARSQFASDAAFALHRSKDDTVSFPDYRSGYNNPTGMGWVPIQAIDGWQFFTEDRLSLRFNARGGPTWICAALQLHCSTGKTWAYDGSGNRVSKYRQPGFGYLVALRVNGTLLNETILGSGDLDNEDFRQAVNGDSSSKVSQIARDELRYPQGGGGLSGALLPVRVDCTLDLVPGDTLVEVAIMNIKGSMQTFESPTTYIGQCEILALEGNR